MFLPDLLHKLLWVIYFGDIKIQLPNYRLNENTTVLNRKYTLLIHNPSNLKIILVQKNATFAHQTKSYKFPWNITTHDNNSKQTHNNPRATNTFKPRIYT